MLDIKLIEEDKFKPKEQIFYPRETFQFILDMFEPEIKIRKLSFRLEIGETSSCMN